MHEALKVEEAILGAEPRRLSKLTSAVQKMTADAEEAADAALEAAAAELVGMNSVRSRGLKYCVSLLITEK